MWTATSRPSASVILNWFQTPSIWVFQVANGDGDPGRRLEVDRDVHLEAVRRQRVVEPSLDDRVDALDEVLPHAVLEGALVDAADQLQGAVEVASR